MQKCSTLVDEVLLKDQNEINKKVLLTCQIIRDSSNGKSPDTKTPPSDVILNSTSIFISDVSLSMVNSIKDSLVVKLKGNSGV